MKIHSPAHDLQSPSRKISPHRQAIITKPINEFNNSVKV